MCVCVCGLDSTPHQSFLAEAQGEMAALLKLYSRMKQEYRQAVKFFGEDPANMRIDDFFGTFASFIADFEVCNSKL